MLSRKRKSGAFKASARPFKRAAINRARMVRAAAPRRNRSYRSANIRSGGVLGIEHKFYDTALVATNVAAPADCTGGELDPSSTSMISTPSQGDGPSNRDGKRIVIESVQIKGNLQYDAQVNLTAGVSARGYLIALVQDTQSNGVQLNSEDVFSNPAAAAEEAPQALWNLLFGPRFKVLKLWKGTLHSGPMSYDGTNMETAQNRKEIECFIKCQIPVNFNAGTTSSIANVIDNSLHMIGFCSDTIQLGYNARIRFVG